MIDLALNNDIILNSDLDAALQELDILFSTTQTELLGDFEFGTNFYKFLWESTLSPGELKKYITDKISESCYYFNKFNYNIDVEAYYDDNYDSAYRVSIVVSYTDSMGITEKRRRIYTIE